MQTIEPSARLAGDAGTAERGVDRMPVEGSDAAAALPGVIPSFAADENRAPKMEGADGRPPIPVEPTAPTLPAASAGAIVADPAAPVVGANGTPRARRQRRGNDGARPEVIARRTAPANLADSANAADGTSETGEPTLGLNGADGHALMAGADPAEQGSSLTGPVVDATAAAAPREQRRAERQQARAMVARAAAVTGPDALSLAADGTVAEAAMVRHISALSESLNQAHHVIHLLNMEKYAAQKELAELKQLPPPPLPAPPVWRPRRGPDAAAALQPGRPERRPIAARRRAKGELLDDEPLDLDLQALAEARNVVRRRQIIAASIVGGIGLFVLLYSYMGWHWFPNLGDRASLTQIAYIGGFMQIFFIGWMFFRFAKVGGKGARWLFPREEDQIKDLRRKRVLEAQRAQLRAAKELQAATNQAARTKS